MGGRPKFASFHNKSLNKRESNITDAAGVIIANGHWNKKPYFGRMSSLIFLDWDYAILKGTDLRYRALSLSHLWPIWRNEAISLVCSQSTGEARERLDISAAPFTAWKLAYWKDRESLITNLRRYRIGDIVQIRFGEDWSNENWAK